MYNPSDQLPINIAFGVTDLPLNGKSLYYDTALQKYRSFISASECTGYFAAEFKDPTFLCVVNEGGTLQNDATFIGGIDVLYWFQDSVNATRLIPINAPLVGSVIYDPIDEQLKYWNGTEYLVFSGTTPTDPAIWVDTNNWNDSLVWAD